MTPQPPTTARTLRVRLGIARALLALALLAAPGVGHAQDAEGTGDTPEQAAASETDSIEQRLAEAQAQLAPIQAALDASSPQSVDVDQIRAQRNLLRDLVAVLEHQQQLTEQGPEALEPQPVPVDVVSIVTLADLYRELGELDFRRRRLDAAVAASESEGARARENFSHAETRRRAARDELAEAGPEAEHAARDRHELRVLESRLAGEEVRLREVEAEHARAVLANQDARIERLSERIQALRDALREGGGGDSENLADLTRAEGELHRDEKVLERDLARTSAELEAARRRLASGEATPRLRERMRGLELAQEVVEERLALVGTRMERLRDRRTYLDRWQRVVRGTAERAELREWREAAEELAQTVRDERLQQEGRVADLQERADDVAARLAATKDPELRVSLEAQRDALEELAAVHARAMRSLGGAETLLAQFIADVDEASGFYSATDLVADTLEAARDTYSYELAVVADEPITVGTVVLAIGLLAVGFAVSRRVSDLLGRTARERFSVETGAAAAIQTLAFYALLVGSALLALRMVNFPLTAFTVLGGALAIGVGFGSQNVMNNFISGLILMLERPVRSGDLVELATGTMGMVENIGARSTRIRAGDSKHIIVPNSFFLENNVVNWTLSDDLIRAQVNVGVIYGSPTREVEKLIREVLHENPKILHNPAPLVLFAEFGDNSLNFVVYFWTRARSPMQLASVESEVRFRIDDVFREANLVIAFPQRDVHLDTVAPLEVRMVGGGAKAEDGAS